MKYFYGFLFLTFFQFPFLVSNASEPIGSYLQGMAGAGVAMPRTASTVYYNPAGIYLNNRITADITLRFEQVDLPAGWGISYLKYTRLIRSGAGFGIYRLRDSLFPEKGDAIAFYLATVHPTPSGLPIGLSIKYINERWNSDHRSSYFSSDMGILFPYRGWLLGMNYQSFTNPGSHLFPSRILLGLSKSLGTVITAAFQANFQDWKDVIDVQYIEYRVGLEFKPSSTFSLQGGWVSLEQDEYWTGGLGLFAKKTRAKFYVAYHWYPEKNVDDRFFVSYSYFLM